MIYSSSFEGPLFNSTYPKGDFPSSIQTRSAPINHPSLRFLPRSGRGRLSITLRQAAHLMHATSQNNSGESQHWLPSSFDWFLNCCKSSANERLQGQDGEPHFSGRDQENKVQTAPNTNPTPNGESAPIMANQPRINGIKEKNRPNKRRFLINKTLANKYPSTGTGAG